MKTKQLFSILAAAAFLFAACEKPEPPVTGGDDDNNNPPVEETKFVAGTLVANANLTGVTLRAGSEETKSLAFVFETDSEVKEERTVTLAIDETLADGKTLLPEANYEFATEFTVAAGADKSPAQTIVFKAAGLEAGSYVLPIVEVVPEGETASEPLVYEVTVRVPTEILAPLTENRKFVLYVDTDIYDPRIATNVIISDTNNEENKEYLGWIVNLRPAYVKNEGGRAVLTLGERLAESFADAQRYLLPIQDKGSKLCLTIEGGNSGLGFSNMTEAQIDDFVAQVYRLVYSNDLDGVNLWDRGASYDKAAGSGLPEVNTTSYPLLIKKLRESLGSSKLITVVDDGEPTASFHDKALCGDIEVGGLIDYAWNGHYDPSEGPVLVDPYHPEHELVSKEYTHKPILGLDPSRYGCVTYSKLSGSGNEMQLYEEFFMNYKGYVDAGNRQSDFYVLLDVISSDRDEYETCWTIYTSLLFMILSDFQDMFQGDWIIKNVYYLDENGEERSQGMYNKWKWGWLTDENFEITGNLMYQGFTILEK